MSMTGRNGYDDDPVLAPLLSQAREEFDTLGIILHGSRGAGVGQADSDYDLDWVLTDAAYDRKKAEGALTIEPVFDEERKVIDAEYTSPAVLSQVPSRTEWMVPAYATAEILLDKTGELADIVRRMTTMPEEQARGEAAA